MKIIEQKKSHGKQRIRVATKNEQPSMTQQAFAEDCDVNIILDRYMKTGELPKPRQGVYADVSEVPDLSEAIQIVQQAQTAFDSLPAKIRYEFHNDPTKLLNFIADPKNKEKAIELGLIEAKQEVKLEPPTASEGAKDGQAT